ncbi:MAG: hypothetical protein EOO38_10365, partial [Cytophagaceae bacterium]
EGPRSTPQLSFTVRELNADAGVVLTASHNPPHDNGFKAYFNAGAQIVDPHATGIINEVTAVTSEHYTPVDQAERGTVTILGVDMDERYKARLKTLLLKPSLLENGSAKVVVTNLHGTGGHIVVPMLRDFGFEVETVPEQDVQDALLVTDPLSLSRLFLAMRAGRPHSTVLKMYARGGEEVEVWVRMFPLYAQGKCYWYEYGYGVLVWVICVVYFYE